MSGDPQLLQRVEKAVGRPTATMFVERGQDRHFIFELSMAGVALYLLGKYLDGFVEGLGVKELGNVHGQAIKDAAKCGFEAFSGSEQPDEKELARHAESLSVVIIGLSDYRTSRDGLARGAAQVKLLLEGTGIPAVDAERTTKRISVAIWQS